MDNKHIFCIAELLLKAEFAPNGQNDISLLPSFEPFRVKEDNDGCLVYGNGEKCNAYNNALFTLLVDDNIKPIDKTERTRIDVFDTGNGLTAVDALADGGYQFLMKDIEGHSCCMLQTNNDFTKAVCALNGTYGMRRFGLNNALMMLYAFRGSFFKTLLIHASTVRNNGYGYAFTAKSGTGKSTHCPMDAAYQRLRPYERRQSCSKGGGRQSHDLRKSLEREDSLLPQYQGTACCHNQD